MDTLKALMVFMTTAENGSFSDAARKLGVSPAAISQSIARLEQELEVRLFNRTTRQLTLTEDGRRFILPLMGEFCQRHPKIRVFFGLDDHFSDLIEDGFDVGVRVGMMPDSRMSARHLAQLPLYTVATPEYWAKNGRPQKPDDLSGHNCINFQFPTSGRLCKWEFEREGERIPLEVNGIYTLNDIEAVCEMARLGFGVAQVPGHEAMPYLRSGELEAVLTDFVSLERSIYICFPHREHIAPRTRVFVDYVIEKLADHPDIVADLPGVDLSAKREAAQP